MGYHVHQLIMHAVHPARNDFVEMFLHHVVTLMLYGFSYMTNMTTAGAIIMFLHDWADLFTSMARCFSETTIKPMMAFSGVGMVLSWAYTRLYIFPYIIYHCCFEKDIY